VNPNELTAEARKILKRWAAQDFYVYIRPMSGVYAGGKKKSQIFWSISVEYRGVEWQQIRGEGWNISKLIVEMSGRVPNRERIQPGYEPGKETGWLAAKKAADQQKADMKAARQKAKKKLKLIEGGKTKKKSNKKKEKKA
jgi:hypothetical protein